MNAHETEALDYPAAHRDRVIELLRRRDGITTALDGLPSSAAVLKRQRRISIFLMCVVALIVISCVVSLAGIVSGGGLVIVNMVLVAGALTGLIVVTKGGHAQSRRKRLELTLSFTNFQLDQLRNDYTTPESEMWESDIESLDALQPGMVESTDRFVIWMATIALIVHAVTFVWFSLDALIN